MSVRLLTREEIGLISSYMDYDIAKQVLKKVYDYHETVEGAEDADSVVLRNNNRKRFGLWLFRINSIAVNMRYGVMLSAPDEFIFYTSKYKQRYYNDYISSLRSMLYQLDDIDDIFSVIFKNALREQLRRLKENE